MAFSLLAAKRLRRLFKSSGRGCCESTASEESSLQASEVAEVPDSLLALGSNDLGLVKALGEWGGIEKLVRCAWISEVPGSAQRLFLLATGFESDGEARVQELERARRGGGC